MNKKLQKKSILGGAVNVPGADDPKYTESKSIKTPPEEKVRIVVPYQGSKEITLNRMGTTEKELVLTMTDPKATQDQKDSRLAAYLFERGRESASFLAELFVFKGAHTKETRKFKQQLRFDFTAFIDAFQVFLLDASKGIKRNIGADINKEEFEKIKDTSGPDVALYNLAMRFESCASMLGERMRKITEDRLKESGYGIFLDKEGKPFREDEVSENGNQNTSQTS